LFFDRFYVQRMQGLSFVMHQPVKDARNPILTPHYDWEGWRTFPYGKSVLFDPSDGLYKLWYETQHSGDVSGSWEAQAVKRIAYATSTDGLHWQRPPLGQLERNGSRHNSLIEMGPFGVHFANVILDDEHDPDPARRFKMMFWAMPPDKGKGDLPMGVSVAVSADGLRWTLPCGSDVPFVGRNRWQPGAISAGDGVSLLGWAEQHQRYVAFLKSNDLVYPGFRTICYTESADFIGWTKPINVLSPDEFDPWGTEFYYMTVFPYGDLYLGLLCVYHDYSQRRGAWPDPRALCPPELAALDQRLDVRLTYSRDLQVWRQLGDRQPFIPVGEPGSWDSGMIFGSTIMPMGDEFWIYYGGSPMRHVRDDLQHAGETIDGQLWGIFGGIGRLRRDGFVSLQAGDEPGELVTQPLVLSGAPITVNARTEEKGMIQVSLLDGDENLIAAADGFRGDALDAVLNFEAGRLASLAGQYVRLRITCCRGDLFALAL
jgi:hypothetical protein